MLSVREPTKTKFLTLFLLKKASASDLFSYNVDTGEFPHELKHADISVHQKKKSDAVTADH